MRHSESNAKKLRGWGDSGLAKLPGVSRKRRKRCVSKIRRRLDKKACGIWGMDSD